MNRGQINIPRFFFAINMAVLLNHGYTPKQALGYNLRFAGLFSLPIPIRFAFGIGVSQ
jgi:hypothetical protein